MLGYLAPFEQRCHKALKSAGFESILGWESCCMHTAFNLVLSVYADDFKLAGPKTFVWGGISSARSSRLTSRPLLENIWVADAL